MKESKFRSGGVKGPPTTPRPAAPQPRGRAQACGDGDMNTYVAISLDHLADLDVDKLSDEEVVRLREQLLHKEHMARCRAMLRRAQERLRAKAKKAGSATTLATEDREDDGRDVPTDSGLQPTG